MYFRSRDCSNGLGGGSGEERRIAFFGDQGRGLLDAVAVGKIVPPWCRCS